VRPLREVRSPDLPQHAHPPARKGGDGVRLVLHRVQDVRGVHGQGSRCERQESQGAGRVGLTGQEHLLFCDSCDRGWHGYCLDP
jgi:hypothetical protein